MSGCNKKVSSNDTSDDSSITRRSTLRRLGATSVAGVVGLGTVSGNAAASHCGTAKDDSNYYEEASGGDTDSGTDCDNGHSVELVSSTDVAHMATYEDSSRITHVFYTVTTAACEYETGDQDEARMIDYNSLEIDATSLENSMNEGGVDFCNYETGIKPAEGDDEVQAVFETIADIALDYVAPRISYGVDFMEGVAAYYDAVSESSSSDFYTEIDYDRSGDSWYWNGSYWAKIQSRFEINIPKLLSGEVSGRVDITATSEADTNCPTSELQTNDNVYIYISGTDVRVYTF